MASVLAKALCSCSGLAKNTRGRRTVQALMSCWPALRPTARASMVCLCVCCADCAYACIYARPLSVRACTALDLRATCTPFECESLRAI